MASSFPRIVVVGAGAIGGWIAARLALAGQSVAVLTRAGTTLKDLCLTEAGETRRTPILVTGDAASLGEQDIVLFAVKAPALANAANQASPLIGPHTWIVPLLNGVPWWFLDGAALRSVDPDGRIAATLPFDRVIGTVVHAACRRAGPGDIVVTHADKLLVGEPGGGGSSRVEQLCAFLETAGIRALPETEIRRAIWYKLWGNMTMNPLSALTLATADRLLKEPGLTPFILACMAEAAAIGGAIGCPIAESGEDRMAVTARLGAFKTSMLQDVEAGRAIELEALVGAPREIARRVGIATPAIDQLYAMTRLMAQSRGLLA